MELQPKSQIFLDVTKYPRFLKEQNKILQQLKKKNDQNEQKQLYKNYSETQIDIGRFLRKT